MRQTEINWTKNVAYGVTQPYSVYPLDDPEVREAFGKRLAPRQRAVWDILTGRHWHIYGEPIDGFDWVSTWDLVQAAGSDGPKRLREVRAKLKGSGWGIEGEKIKAQSSWRYRLRKETP